MAERDRARPTPDSRSPGRDTRDTRDAPGAQDRAGADETPGGAAVGEVGRIRGEPGASDLAGDADLDPRADAERMAERVVDDVDRNDEAD